MALQFFKLNALPETLVANSLYFIKSSTTGLMEVYMSNESGSAARKVTGEAEVAAAIAAYDAQGASKLNTARNISITGDATGTQSFDGSADASIEIELAAVGASGEQGGIVTTDTKGRVISSRALTAADLPASITSDTTGNAATATNADAADKVNSKLTINGTEFDGSVAVNLALAPLVNGLVPSENLPSYVDDVIEADDHASLPAEGEAGKIYVTIDNGNVYRWSGSTYIRINDAVSTADTADTLATARDIALSGDATGTASFDGSQNITIATTLASVGTAGEQGAVVTTDAKGRVVSSRALELSDLPEGITASGVDFSAPAEW